MTFRGLNVIGNHASFDSHFLTTCHAEELTSRDAKALTGKLADSLRGLNRLWVESFPAAR